MSIFTSKKFWNFWCKFSWQNLIPKFTRGGVKVPCLMPIRVKTRKKGKFKSSEVRDASSSHLKNNIRSSLAFLKFHCTVEWSKDSLLRIVLLDWPPYEPYVLGWWKLLSKSSMSETGRQGARPPRFWPRPYCLPTKIFAPPPRFSDLGTCLIISWLVGKKWL